MTNEPTKETPKVEVKSVAKVEAAPPTPKAPKTVAPVVTLEELMDRLRKTDASLARKVIKNITAWKPALGKSL